MHFSPQPLYQPSGVQSPNFLEAITDSGRVVSNPSPSTEGSAYGNDAVLRSSNLGRARARIRRPWHASGVKSKKFPQSDDWRMVGLPRDWNRSVVRREVWRFRRRRGTGYRRVLLSSVSSLTALRPKHRPGKVLDRIIAGTLGRRASVSPARVCRGEHEG